MAQGSHGASHHRRSRDHDPGLARYTAVEWQAKEAAYQRELDEGRARAQQMEKTMRWWSDCTANWREKWTKMRTERNKARDEVKQLKKELDAATKELATIRNERSGFEQQLMEAKKDNETLLSISESKIVSSEIGEDAVELRRKPIAYPNEPSVRQRASLDSHKFTNVDNVLASKLTELRLRLDEACKSVQTEKEQKAFLLAKVETLTAELHSAKMESHSTLGSSDSSHSQVERLQNELQDEITAKQVLEEKIAELRMEVERLKSENNVQWSKREMLETENVAILRENKKMFNQICELRERIHKLNRISDNAYLSDHNDASMFRNASPRSQESKSIKSSKSSGSETNMPIDEKNVSVEDLVVIE